MPPTEQETDGDDREPPEAGYIPSPVTVVAVIVSLYVWRKLQGARRWIEARVADE